MVGLRTADLRRYSVRSKMNMKCDECEKVLEFGKDGVCNCGKELCFDCYQKNGHREHMSIDSNSCPYAYCTKRKSNIGCEEKNCDQRVDR